MSAATVPVSAAVPAATVTWNVGVATSALTDCTSAVAGIVAVIVSFAVMSYAATAGNVIVTSDGRAVVVDFGLALVSDLSQALTKDSRAVLGVTDATGMSRGDKVEARLANGRLRLSVDEIE